MPLPGESDRPSPCRPGLTRTSPSSPLRSRGGAGPDDETDRPDLRGPKRAVGRQAASACPVNGSGAGLSRRAIERFQRGSRGAAGSRLKRQRALGGEAAALVLATQEFVANGGGQPSCVGAAEVLHRRGGRAAVAVSVGVGGGVPDQQCWTARSGWSRLLQVARSSSPGHRCSSRRQSWSMRLTGEWNRLLSWPET
jgi:hypothetical protein